MARTFWRIFSNIHSYRHKQGGEKSFWEFFQMILNFIKALNKFELNKRSESRDRIKRFWRLWIHLVLTNFPRWLAFIIVGFPTWLRAKHNREIIFFSFVVFWTVFAPVELSYFLWQNPYFLLVDVLNSTLLNFSREFYCRVAKLRIFLLNKRWNKFLKIIAKCYQPMGWQ